MVSTMGENAGSIAARLSLVVEPYLGRELYGNLRIAQPFWPVAGDGCYEWHLRYDLPNSGAASIIFSYTMGEDAYAVNNRRQERADDAFHVLRKKLDFVPHEIRIDRSRSMAEENAES
jgi:hypothetical protein